MSDFLDSEARSSLMSRVRDRNTLPERLVRKAVWAAGFRYRLNVRELPGTPDMVFRRYRNRRVGTRMLLAQPRLPQRTPPPSF